MAVEVVVEDGAGLSTANAYDTVATCSTWLSGRGMNVFSDGDADLQPYWLTEATRVVESQIERRVDGLPINEDQALLYPRYPARDSRGRRLDSDERPAGLREAIFLMAEKYAVAHRDGVAVPLVDDGGHIAAERSGGSGHTFRRERSFGDLHPEVWDRAKTALYHAAIRSERA